MTTSQWLTLSDLGRRFGISTGHCGRALDKQGWRDRRGLPTEAAIVAGAAQQQTAHHLSPASRWNVEVCASVLSNQGYRPLSRSEHVSQWVSLLEAMEQGSDSISTSADQMAEELPTDLVEDVNHQLMNRGCRFQVSRLEKTNCC